MPRGVEHEWQPDDEIVAAAATAKNKRALAKKLGVPDVTFGSCPMTEVRVTDPRTGGQKGSKPQRFDLLPWEPIARISEVYGFGAEKYEAHNWRRGYVWSLSFAALQRHLAAFWGGEDVDPESGLSHLAHAGFHIFALLEFCGDERFADLDDRYRPSA